MVPRALPACLHLTSFLQAQLTYRWDMLIHADTVMQCDAQEISDSDSFGWEARACTSYLAEKAGRALADSAHESSSTGLSRQSSTASSSAEPSAAQQRADEAAKRVDDSAAQLAATEARKAKAKARQVGGKNNSSI